MQLQGEENFESRQQIIRLLNALSVLPRAVFEKKVPFSQSFELSVLKEQPLYSGTYAVRSLIRQVIDRELGEKIPVIRMNAPVDDGFLQNYIYTIYQQYDTPLKITHIIPFQADWKESGSHAGISIMKDILSLSLSAGTQYEPYFFYDNPDCFLDPFPFYLLTSSALLCIARGFETVLYITDPSVLQYYTNFFLHTLKLCRPLLHFQKDPFEILRAYSEGTASSSYYNFMPQPCFGKFYSPELIADKIKKELPYYQQLLEASEQRFSMLRKITHHYYTFFTKKGLADFMKNGIICDIPRKLIHPLTPGERRVLVENMRSAIAEDLVLGRLTNERLLTLPKNLSFCISEKRQLDIFTLQESDEDEHFYNIHIQESLIGNAFMDFILWLPKSEYLLSKEETLSFMDELLKK